VKLTPQMKLVLAPTESEWRKAAEDPIAICRETLRRVAEAALPGRMAKRP
jgi:hypothetical protein